MGNEVERVDANSVLELKALLQDGSRPFLVNDSVDEGVREHSWSAPSLRSRVGDRKVSVTRSEGGTFDYTTDGQPLYSDVSLPFFQAIELIESSKAPDPCYYLRRALLADIGLDNNELLPQVFQLARGTKRTERLWASSDGSVTPLHYDTRNNLLTQMHGSKLVTLFPSSEHERMYPMEFTGTNLLSHVDPEAVDASRFPSFPSELKITVEFNPGETLFIPPFWWHHVRSREFSISVNVFWQLRPEQCLVTNSIEYLRVMYQRNGLADLFRGESEPDQLSFANLAARAHELGLNGAATLFGAAYARVALQTSPSIAKVASAESVGSDTAGEIEITAGELARLEYFVLLGGLTAQGKTPKSSAVSAMVAEVFHLASRQES